MEDKNYEVDGYKCIICEVMKKQGYYLKKSFICIDCENDIIYTETNSPFYKFFVDQVKKINMVNSFS